MPEARNICPVCKKPVEPNDSCYQMRLGAIEEDGVTFLVEEDVGYYHQLCMVAFP